MLRVINFVFFFYSYSESEIECPACHSENKRIIDIIKSQKQSQHHHDQFHSQLEKADDGFAVVADYFGRGLFRKKEDNVPLMQQQVAMQNYRDLSSPLATQSSDSIADQMKSMSINQQNVVANVDSGVTIPTARHGTQHSTSRSHSTSLRQGRSPNRVGSNKAKVQEVALNPFGDSFDDSPKKSSPKPSNPFGEDTEEKYDQAQNPFC